MSTVYTHQITVRATEESVRRLDWFAEKLSTERGTVVTRADALRELAHTALRDHESGLADEAQLALLRREYERKRAAGEHAEAERDEAARATPPRRRSR